MELHASKYKSNISVELSSSFLHDRVNIFYVLLLKEFSGLEIAITVVGIGHADHEAPSIRTNLTGKRRSLGLYN
jgi:hypothetical protein